MGANRVQTGIRRGEKEIINNKEMGDATKRQCLNPEGEDSSSNEENLSSKPDEEGKDDQEQERGESAAIKSKPLRHQGRSLDGSGRSEAKVGDLEKAEVIE